MEEPHYVYLQFEDGTFARLPSMYEADRIYRYYERKHARQREGVESCWVVRPSDHQVVLGKSPANWSPNSPVRQDFARDWSETKNPVAREAEEDRAR